MCQPIITKSSIAAQVAALIGGKVWVGGDDKVRVYLGKGYVEIRQAGCDARKLNNHNAYSAIREAGLEYFALTVASSPKAVSAQCLNCGVTASIVLGRGYCTDCHGEC